MGFKLFNVELSELLGEVTFFELVGRYKSRALFTLWWEPGYRGGYALDLFFIHIRKFE